MRLTVARSFTLGCIFAGTLASGTALGQELHRAPPGHAANYVIKYVEPKSIDAPVTIFTNLSTDPLNVYDAPAGGFYVLGPTNSVAFPEQWIAIPFVPKVASHAKTVKTAIGIISGTARLKIGIYTDVGGTVGAPVAGGQGVATVFPTAGVCCTLTTTTFPGAGASLTAGTTYWLVARSDDTMAPDFTGVWQSAVAARFAANLPDPPPGSGWFTVSNNWPAASITGTTP
jgi:hypothetical protein